MWYVKDQFSEKIYFKSNDVRKTQNYVSWYNSTFKFSSQRIFRFVLSDFSGIVFFGETKIDINGFTKKHWLFDSDKYVHPLSVKDFSKRHKRYVELKYKKICDLCRKYHVWSYTADGRKCDGFDF